MMFIKATIFSLLTFSTAILAEPKCSDTFDVLVSDVEDCIKHLQEENGDGTTQCTGITDGIELYQSGSAHIMGYTDGVDETYSWCKHVADSAQEIIDSCSNEDGYTGGSNVAVGNGDFIVEVTTQ